MSDATLLRKDQLETSLHNERKLIEAGKLKEDNPLDLSEPFKDLCEACRRGDLKVCQEKITEGTNINGRDLYDYTPLILVSSASSSCAFDGSPFAAGGDGSCVCRPALNQQRKMQWFRDLSRRTQ